MRICSSLECNGLDSLVGNAGGVIRTEINISSHCAGLSAKLGALLSGL